MLRIWDLATKVDFVVCDTLSVPCVIGCSYINTYVDAIRPGRSKVQRQEADGTKRGETAIIQDLSQRDSYVNIAEFYADTEPKAIRLAKRTRFEPFTEVVVTINCELSGTCLVRSATRIYNRHGLTLANGIMGMPRVDTTRVVVATYRRKGVTLPKGTRICIAELFEGDVITPPSAGQPGPPAVLPVEGGV